MNMTLQHYLNKLQKERNLKPTTIKIFKSALKQYEQLNQMTLTELLEEAEKEEEKGIRWKHRQLPQRLLQYQNHLLQHYNYTTAETYLTKVKTFYKHHLIEIHTIPRVNTINTKKSRPITYQDLPTKNILKEAYKHKGTSVCEILQNCVIFNDGCHSSVYDKKERARNAIYVRHGQPLVFGEDNQYGLVQEGFGLRVVEIGKDGITMDDILVHDAHSQDNTLQLKLALMGDGDGFPIALGVIRDVEAPTYDESVTAQIQEVSSQKKYHSFAELLETNDIWEVNG